MRRILSLLLTFGVLTGLAFAQGQNTKPGSVSYGILYEFKVSDDHIAITFPGDPKPQTAGLGGELRLLLYARDLNQKGTVPIRVVTIDESIGPFILPVDSNGDGRPDKTTTASFRLTTALLEGGTASGFIDLSTGKYNLKYVLKFDQKLASQYGAGSLKQIIFDENGTIDFKQNALTTSGNLTIPSGTYEGTRITYSPKRGNAPKPLPVLEIAAVPSGCGYVCQVSVQGRVTGSGVFNSELSPAKVQDPARVASPQLAAADPISPGNWNSSSFEGSTLAGEWRVTYGTEAQPCQNVGDVASVLIQYRP